MVLMTPISSTAPDRIVAPAGLVSSSRLPLMWMVLWVWILSPESRLVPPLVVGVGRREVHRFQYSLNDAAIIVDALLVKVVIRLALPLWPFLGVSHRKWLGPPQTMRGAPLHARRCSNSLMIVSIPSLSWPMAEGT